FLAVLLEEPALLAQARSDLERVTLPQGPLAEVLTVLFLGGGAETRAVASDEARRLYTAAAAMEVAPSGDRALMVRKRVNRLRREALRGEAAAVERAIQEAERAKSEPGRL